MKTASSPLLFRSCLLFLLACLGWSPALRAQTTGAPPELMSYQGYLADASGAALASDRPRNYEVTFRIYSSLTGTSTGERLWTERQTVTVDKGYFSVLLGQGATVVNENNPATFSSVFQSANASDRYIGLFVSGLGAGGGELTIAPRLRLLPTPYAFLAKNAQNLLNSGGTGVVTVAGTSVAINKPTASTTLDVNGTVTATAFAGSGTSLTGLNANNIASGTVPVGNIPNLSANKITADQLSVDRIPSLDAGKITSGTFADSRLSGNVAMRNASQTFYGSQSFNNGLTFLENLIMGDNAKIVLRNGGIRLRAFDDPNHQLGHVGIWPNGDIGGIGVDGAVLHGYEGGILGFMSGASPVGALRWTANAVEAWGRSATSPTAATAYGAAQQLLVRPRDMWNGNMKGNRLSLGMAHVNNFEYTGVIQAYAGSAGDTLGGTTLRLNPLGGTVYANSSTISDRHVKQDFKEVDFKEVLEKVAAMPVTTWAYTNSAKTTHMGPVAQDFSAAFGLGDDNKAIAVTDATGVAFAAIKGLNTVVQEKDAEIQNLKRELQELRSVVEGLARQNGANRQ